MFVLTSIQQIISTKFSTGVIAPVVEDAACAPTESFVTEPHVCAGGCRGQSGSSRGGRSGNGWGIRAPEGWGGVDD